MTREELASDTAATLTALNEKVRAAVDLGKPGEAADYSAALRDTAYAYDTLETGDE